MGPFQTSKKRIKFKIADFFAMVLVCPLSKIESSKSPETARGEIAHTTIKIPILKASPGFKNAQSPGQKFPDF